MSDGLDFKEFLSGFLAEADEHLTSANRNLLAADEALKKGQLPARQVRELFRSLHTLKGLASMVGVEPIVDISHEMETVLRESDRAGGKLGAGSVDVLLGGVRAIEERVTALSRGQAVSPAPRELVRALSALRLDKPARPVAGATLQLEPALLERLAEGEKAQITQAADGGQHVYRIDFRPSPSRMAEGVTISAVRERLAAHGDLVKVVPRSVAAGPDAPAGLSFLLLFVSAQNKEEVCAAAGLTDEEVALVAVEPLVQTDAEAAAEAQAGRDAALAAEEAGLEAWEADETDLASAARSKTLVRVDVNRLDEALERLSALLVTRHRLARAVTALSATGADVRELSQILGDNARQLRDLRSSIMAARMVPVAHVLERVPLMVRGLSNTTGKAVRLQLELGDAEVDKSVGERLFPAIVHLIRNAVDHGIESPPARAAAGKSAEGMIHVACFNRSSAQLELRISDDGRGIDPAQVAKSAGVQTPEDARGLLALITRPGLSTRDQADHTSGRGMGMDIVRKVVEEQLSGELELQTEPGRGTTFVIRIPLSITIVDAFTFMVADERFAVPVSAIEEILEVDPTRVTDPPAPDAIGALRQMVARRGEALPLVSLGRVFGMPQAGLEVRKALVIRRNGSPVAFGVSRMLGQQEIVVRPLEDPLVRVPGAAGSTDLGDGRPTLVLDLPALATATFTGRGGNGSGPRAPKAPAASGSGAPAARTQRRGSR